MNIKLTENEMAVLHYLMYNEEPSIQEDTEENSDNLRKGFYSLAKKIGYELSY